MGESGSGRYTTAAMIVQPDAVLVPAVCSRGSEAHH